MAKSKDFKGMTYRVDKSGKRKTTVARQDAVSEKLAECTTPEQVVELAGDFGIRADELTERAKRAPNFGQFRMVIGNRIRGVVNRIARAEEKGEKLLVEVAAYPKEHKKVRVKKKPIKDRIKEGRKKAAPSAKKGSKKAKKKKSRSPTS